MMLQGAQQTQNKAFVGASNDTHDMYNMMGPASSQQQQQRQHHQSPPPPQHHQQHHQHPAPAPQPQQQQIARDFPGMTVATLPMPPLPQAVLTPLPPPPAIAKALHPYTATTPDQISMTQGESFTILTETGDWWSVQNAAGQTGLAPKNFLEKKVQADPSVPAMHLPPPSVYNQAPAASYPKLMSANAEGSDNAPLLDCYEA